MDSTQTIQPASAGPAQGGARITGKFWGVRGSTPTPTARNLGVGGNTSCLELRLPGGEMVILDAGSGIRMLGNALSAGGHPLNIHVLLSHFHWDHLQGLPFFQPLFSPRNSIHFHAGVRPECTRDLLERQMTYPYFPVSFASLPSRRTYHELTEPGLCLGEVQIHSFPLHHPQGSHGFTFHLAGRKLVFATDAEHGEPVADRELLAEAAGADVLILDSQFTPEEYPQRRGRGHSTWLKATQIAREAGAKALYLFHHDPGHDDEELHGILAHARTQFPQTYLAIEGETFEV
jgi:phosphoribosyl 1,2-cyclic phosphodiesterase